MKNRDVAREFVHHGTKARTKHLYIEGDVLYSYGSHYPLAVRAGDTMLVATGTYSRTTNSKHKSPLMYELEGSGWKVIDNLPIEVMKRAASAAQSGSAVIVPKPIETMEEFEEVTKEFFKRQGIIYKSSMFNEFKRYLELYLAAKHAGERIERKAIEVEKVIKLLEKRKLVEAL